MLPLELKVLIASYLPLKRLEVWAEHGIGLLQNRQFLLQLLITRYPVSPERLKLSFAKGPAIRTKFTPFDAFDRTAMLAGDIGYSGQWYLPELICFVYAIQANDLELFQYYWKILRRFITNDSGYRRFPVVRYLLYLSQNLPDFTQFIQASVSGVKPLEPTPARFRFSTEVLTEMEYMLLTLDYQGIADHQASPFPFIDPKLVHLTLTIDDILLTPIFAWSQYMVEEVEKIFPASPNRDYYLACLRVLLGEPVHVVDLVSPGSSGIDIHIYTLALSVFNMKVVNQIPLEQLTATGGLITEFLTGIAKSEVVYQVEMFAAYEAHIDKLRSRFIPDKSDLIFSMLFAKRYLEYGS